MPTRRDQDKSKEYFLSQTKQRRDWLPNIFETKAMPVTFVLRPGGDRDSRPSLQYICPSFLIQLHLINNSGMHDVFRSTFDEYLIYLRECFLACVANH